MIQQLMSDKDTFKIRKESSSQESQVKYANQLPAWLDMKNGIIPPLYESIWNKVRASPTATNCDKELVSQLFTNSQISFETVGYLWGVGNFKSPGTMTQQELYIMLALIGLVQQGIVINNVSELKEIEEPVVPQLDYTRLKKSSTIVMDTKTLWKTHFAKSTITIEDTTKPFNPYTDFDALSMNFLEIVDKESEFYKTIIPKQMKLAKLTARKKKVRNLVNNIRYKLPPIVETNLSGSVLSLESEGDDGENTAARMQQLSSGSKPSENSSNIQSRKLSEEYSDEEASDEEEFAEFQSAQVPQEEEYSDFQFALPPSGAQAVIGSESLIVMDNPAPPLKKPSNLSADILELDPLTSQKLVNYQKNQFQDLPMSQDIFYMNKSGDDAKSAVCGPPADLPGSESAKVGINVAEPSGISEASKEKVGSPKTPVGSTLEKVDGSQVSLLEDKYSALRLLEMDTVTEDLGKIHISQAKTSLEQTVQGEEDDFGDFVAADPVSFSTDDKEKEANAERVKCLKTCAQLLEDAAKLFEGIKNEEFAKQFFSDERGCKYYRQLQIVLETGQKFREKFGSPELNKKLDAAWSVISRYSKFVLDDRKTAEGEQVGMAKCSLPPEREVYCNLCKTICEANIALVNSQYYHVTCYNLYTNFVKDANVSKILG